MRRERRICEGQALGQPTCDGTTSKHSKRRNDSELRPTIAPTIARSGEHFGELARQRALSSLEVTVLNVVERRTHLTGQTARDLVAVQISNCQPFKFSS